jgi:hypothetical protein
MKKLTLLFLAVLSLSAIAEEEKKEGFNTVGEVFIAIGEGIDSATNTVVEVSTDAVDWVEVDSEGWFDTKVGQMSVFFGIPTEGDKI